MQHMLPQAGLTFADLHHLPADLASRQVLYQKQRARCPVVHDTQAACFLVVGCEEVGRMLHAPDLFAAAQPGERALPPAGTIAGIVARQFLFLDGPRHQAVQSHLRKRLGQLAKETEPFISTTVTDLLSAGLRVGHMDLVGEFAAPLSRLLIARVLGIPTHDTGLLMQLEAWSDAFGDITSGQIKTNLKGILSLYDYFQQLLQQKRRQPTDDLLSAYIAATEAEELRDQEEVIADGMMLFSAGRVTLRKLIPGVMWELLRQDPDWVRTVRAALPVTPNLINTLTEEALRWGTPTTRLARWTTSEVALADQVIPPGAKVFALLEATNFDERCFLDPARFDPFRLPNRHRTFGAGPHICTGAPVARKAAQIAFAALLNVPHLALLSDDPPPMYANTNIGGITSCVVTLEA